MESVAALDQFAYQAQPLGLVLRTSSGEALRAPKREAEAMAGSEMELLIVKG
jgi:hypothetical protein